MSSIYGTGKGTLCRLSGKPKGWCLAIAVTCVLWFAGNSATWRLNQADPAISVKASATQAINSVNKRVAYIEQTAAFHGIHDTLVRNN